MDHMTHIASVLKSKRDLVKPISICLPNGHMKQVTEVEDIELASGLILKGVFHVPEYKQNLLSFGRLLDDDMLSIKRLDKEICIFQDPRNGKHMLEARRFAKGLYRAEFGAETGVLDKLCINNADSTTDSKLPYTTVHARLGHISLSKIKHIC